MFIGSEVIRMAIAETCLLQFSITNKPSTVLKIR